MIKILLLITLNVFSLTIEANGTLETMWPGTDYEQSIPTHKQVLGYDVGEKITNHADMLRFFESLEKAAPNRIKIFEYGRTWEGRKLIYAAIGNAERIDNLDEFAVSMQKLANPKLTNKQTALQLIKTLPSSVWLQHGVHGDEISSSDAAMMTAYHLLAAPEEPLNKKILESTIVFIDPMQNPDGRMRFINHYYTTVGLIHSSDRLSAEHDQNWPGGRANHYLFDMNRDWLAITQPETAGRIKLLNHYLPLVVIDLHEMGGDQSYFFPPTAHPFNPDVTKTQINNMSAIGKNLGKHFDQFGFDFFTREIFDAFYPGYGDSWPSFYGASAATYEVSSSRGELFKKNTGEVLTYKDTVQRHFVASLATAEAVADNHNKLLNDFYNYQVSAIKMGKNSKSRYYLLPAKRDGAANHRLATLMAQHGVEVKQADNSFKACSIDYSAGSYFIDTAQPRGRFVKTTFEKQIDMDKDFIKEEERRRGRKLDSGIYDMTGWSLPLMFNVDVDSCDKSFKVDSHIVRSDDQLKAKISNPNASVAYLVPWGDMSAGRFLTKALRHGLTIKSADKAFVLDNKKSYPAGTLIIEKRSNKANVFEMIQKIAHQTGASVDGVNSSWVTNGPSFGSSDTVTMVAPNIAMAWDTPTSSLSAGHTRFIIERQFNYPVTAIRTNNLDNADLSNYQVLILPSGYYKSVLGKNAAENIKLWVKRGGVLITLGSATKYASDVDVNLLDVKRELAFKDQERDSDSDKKKSTIKGQLFKSRNDLTSSSENDSESPDYTKGVLANVEVDQEHWLTAGVNKNLITTVRGRDIYAPIKLNAGKNLAWFTDSSNLLASGYLWEENKNQLAYKPFLIHQPLGKGSVVSFTQDPTVRAYLDGLNVLLMNSIFRTAAHAAASY